MLKSNLKTMCIFKAPAMKLEGNFRIPKSKKPAEEKDEFVEKKMNTFVKKDIVAPVPPPPQPVPPAPLPAIADRERVARSPMKRFKGDCWDKSVDLGPLMKKSRAKEPENYLGKFGLLFLKINIFFVVLRRQYCKDS